MNLETILAKKQTILDSLCSCEAILSLLRPESEPELTGAEMKYHFLYPYRRTITADLPACALLCFDLNVAEVPNLTVCETQLKFFFACHESLMNTDGGNRTDLLAKEAERLFSWNPELGIGRVIPAEQNAWTGWSTPAPYYGRRLTFSIQDFQRRP